MINKQPGSSQPELKNTAQQGAGNIVKMSGGYIAGLFVQLLLGFILPRLMGAESYGQYAAIIAVATITQVLSSAGLPLVGSRYLGPLWSKQEIAKATQLASSIWTARLLLSLVAGFVVVAWLALSKKLDLNLFLCIIIGIFCVFRFAFNGTALLLLPLNQVGKMMGLDFLRLCFTLIFIILVFRSFGLLGVFVALMVMSLILLMISSLIVKKILPLKLIRNGFAVLRPYLKFSLLTYIGQIGLIIQSHFSIYGVASFMAKKEAAFLAISIQIHTVAKGLFQSARTSLVPIMATMEEQNNKKQLRLWGGLIMRYGAAVTGFILVSWIFLGKSVIHWALSDSFHPVYNCTNLLLLSLIFQCCALSCNGLLYIRGLAATGAVNNIIFAMSTIVGFIVVITTESTNTLYSLCQVYVMSALLYWCCAYFTLGIQGKIWLPLRRTILLILPSVIVLIFVPGWVTSIIGKICTLAVYFVLYGFYVLKLRLLPAKELKEIVKVLRQKQQSQVKNEIDSDDF